MCSQSVSFSPKRDQFTALKCCSSQSFCIKLSSFKSSQCLEVKMFDRANTVLATAKEPVLRKCTKSGVTCEEDHNTFTHIKRNCWFPVSFNSSIFFCKRQISFIKTCSISACLRHDTKNFPSIDSNKRWSCLCVRMKRMVIARCAST